jgi:hypothetical protein
MLCLSYYLLHFLFNKIGEQEGRTGSARSGGGGGGTKKVALAQTMYTHESNCKNNKRKKKKYIECMYGKFIRKPIINFCNRVRNSGESSE